MSGQLDRIEKMLGAILKSSNHIHWIGSYAHGLTASGDPYIILYPASDKLDIKICRVYDRQFKDLPGFIDLTVPDRVRSSNKTMTKSEAAAAGLLVKCSRMFQIVTYDGKDTRMGKERRFYSSLYDGGSASPPAPVSVDWVPAAVGEGGALAAAVGVDFVGVTSAPAARSVYNWEFLSGDSCPVSFRQLFKKYEDGEGQRPFSLEKLKKWWELGNR